MNEQTFHLFSMATSAAPVPLAPGDGFAETWDQRRVDQEALSGRLHGFRWPAAVLGWSVPLSFVDSGTRATLTGWWRAQEELAFVFNYSSAPELARVRIVNAEEPLGRQMPGVPGRFGGALMLRETQAAGKAPGLPFVLDDAAYGLLDQSINVLA